MTVRARATFLLGCFFVVLFPLAASSQNGSETARPAQVVTRTPRLALAAAKERLRPRPKKIARRDVRPLPVAAPAPATNPAPQVHGLVAAVTLADIGFGDGLHFANLGGHRELYVPLPEEGGLAASDLVLVLDDFAAHPARRNLIVQINDRTVAAIALDGQGRDRTVQVPLGGVRPKDGYLKLSFLYSGAATPDRCVDVRYVGDSVTIRPETAVEVDIAAAGRLDVAGTAELMPREVALVLPGRRLVESEMATALTIARALIAGGRRVSFYDGYETVPELAERDPAGRWARGIILIGRLADAEAVIDSPIATLAGDVGDFGTIAAVRVHGSPALVIADDVRGRAARLFGTPLLAATRGVAAASVGRVSPLDPAPDRVTFDQLGVPPQAADVFGRAELDAIIDTRRLPAGTQPTRLSLDVMVAPDGAGTRAVVSAFVNERLLGSTVAANGEATHFDLPLPAGLVGTLANLRVVVERDIAQGDCRFGPQGYPAQILGSSALLLGSVGGVAHDFSNLTPLFVRGIDVVVPTSAADRPTRVLGLLAQVVAQFSPATAPIDVSYVADVGAPAPALAPKTPFIVVSDSPPAGASLRVRFDRGRVAVVDRAGRTLLDLGGFLGGAVAQIVTAGETPGLWIKPLAVDGQLPSPAKLQLDRGDVAFVDKEGVALAMSTERDTLVRISYPDQVSWFTVADRFRSWIIGGLWLVVTAVLLLALQRLFRRRPANTSE